MKSSRSDYLTIDNVTFLHKRKTAFEVMSYSELLAERAFIREEKIRCENTLALAEEIDPRGMWPERFELCKLLSDMVEGCDYVIKFLEEEMVKRNKEKPK